MNLKTKTYTNEEAKSLNPLQLAFVGDGVYELYIRSYVLATNKEFNVHKLHKEAVNYVKAHGQSESIKAIMDALTDEELYIFKRGRNAKSATVPKNANVTEYRYATGFEAMVGYLYLTDQEERLGFILKSSVDFILGSK